MRCLSVRQPWPYAIIHLGKPVENRSWYSDYTGPLLIHASKTFDMNGYEFLSENPRFDDLYLPVPEKYDRGGIIGRVEMIDCVDEHDSRWFFGPWGYVFVNPEPLPFYPCKGRLGIFNINYK